MADGFTLRVHSDHTIPTRITGGPPDAKARTPSVQDHRVSLVWTGSKLNWVVWVPEEHRMKNAKLCLALVLVAATSTHVAAVELVNPLQVLERSRRAGIEFDQRMKRDV